MIFSKTGPIFVARTHISSINRSGSAATFVSPLVIIRQTALPEPMSVTVCCARFIKHTAPSFRSGQVVNDEMFLIAGQFFTVQNLNKYNSFLLAIDF